MGLDTLLIIIKKRKIASGCDIIVREIIDTRRDLNILYFKKKKKKISGFDIIVEEIIYICPLERYLTITTIKGKIQPESYSLAIC